MKKDISLVDPSNASEEDSFYYNELTGKPYWDLRKMLGRQLFLIRQSYNRTLKRVSADTKIPVDAIDRIECGIGRFYWYEIAQLLEYYKKRAKLVLVNTLTDEERLKAAEEKETARKLELAEEIIAKAKQRDEISEEIATADSTAYYRSPDV